MENTSWGVGTHGQILINCTSILQLQASLGSKLAKLFLMSESRQVGDPSIKAQMTAAMDTDDAADPYILAATLKWAKKRLR